MFRFLYREKLACCDAYTRKRGRLCYAIKNISSNNPPAYYFHVYFRNHLRGALCCHTSICLHLSELVADFRYGSVCFVCYAPTWCSVLSLSFFGY